MTRLPIRWLLHDACMKNVAGTAMFASLGHFKHSCLAAKALRNKQVQLTSSEVPLKVIQDVPTRWNLSYYMLHHLLQLCVPLTAVLCDAKLTPKQADRDMLLKDHQWKLAKQIVPLLEPFEDATTAISGQRYTTLSLMMPITCHLYTVMSTACNKLLSTLTNVPSNR